MRVEFVNESDREPELQDLRSSGQRVPRLGNEGWVIKVAKTTWA